MKDREMLKKLALLVRYFILYMTTKAGSGHATSALSAADLMVCLFFKKLSFDFDNPQNLANDKIIFSKGHASPLLYALWAVAGALSYKDLETYRKFKSPLEGHPTFRFKYADVATGSLGQGLSVGLGMALSAKFLDKLPFKVYVLLGDSEVAEGSVWEAVELASYYKLDNLVGIIDVNRLGQSTETMLGWDIDTYVARLESFGWQAIRVDGHNFEEIIRALDATDEKNNKPKMIIAKTIKGRGVSFLEDKEGWHGIALNQKEFEKAVSELGQIDRSIRGEIEKPTFYVKSQKLKAETAVKNSKLNYKIGDLVPTRKAYGDALVRLSADNLSIVVLDAEVKNSTFVQTFGEKYPGRFFEMFVAEQNMVGTALGLSKLGKIPFVSTFAAFFTRAFDQIRMSAYSGANIKFVGSHAGVSIGEDGPSQMGLEDFALFRSIWGSRVFCPADAVAAQRLVEILAENEGIFYLRIQRPPTPVIYKNDEKFEIGGSKVLRSSKSDRITLVSCGITVLECIQAADELAKKGVNARVVDAYSIKPIDTKTILTSALQTDGNLITCEDHYFEGGLGEAVLTALSNVSKIKIWRLAVGKLPMSGKREELFEYEGISANSIVSKVLEVLR